MDSHISPNYYNEKHYYSKNKQKSKKNYSYISNIPYTNSSSSTYLKNNNSANKYYDDKSNYNGETEYYKNSNYQECSYNEKNNNTFDYENYNEYSEYKAYKKYNVYNNIPIIHDDDNIMNTYNNDAAISNNNEYYEKSKDKQNNGLNYNSKTDGINEYDNVRKDITQNYSKFTDKKNYEDNSKVIKKFIHEESLTNEYYSQDIKGKLNYDIDISINKDRDNKESKLLKAKAKSTKKLAKKLNKYKKRLGEEKESKNYNNNSIETIVTKVANLLNNDNIDFRTSSDKIVPKHKKSSKKTTSKPHRLIKKSNSSINNNRNNVAGKFNKLTNLINLAKILKSKQINKTSKENAEKENDTLVSINDNYNNANNNVTHKYDKMEYETITTIIRKDNSDKKESKRRNSNICDYNKRKNNYYAQENVKMTNNKALISNNKNEIKDKPVRKNNLKKNPSSMTEKNMITNTITIIRKANKKNKTDINRNTSTNTTKDNKNSLNTINNTSLQLANTENKIKINKPSKTLKKTVNSIKNNINSKTNTVSSNSNCIVNNNKMISAAKTIKMKEPDYSLIFLTPYSPLKKITYKNYNTFNSKILKQTYQSNQENNNNNNISIINRISSTINNKYHSKINNNYQNSINNNNNNKQEKEEEINDIIFKSFNKYALLNNNNSNNNDNKEINNNIRENNKDNLNSLNNNFNANNNSNTQLYFESLAFQPFTYINDNSIIEKNLENGRFQQGVIRMNKGLNHGYITIPGLVNDILVRGGKNLNLTINKDKVILELFPMICWKPILYSNYNITNDEYINNTSNYTNNYNINANNNYDNYNNSASQPLHKHLENFISNEERIKYINTRLDLRPEGRIVKIISSPNTSKDLICKMKSEKGIYYAHPIQENLPKILVKKPKFINFVFKENSYCYVQIDQWHSSYNFLFGYIVREIKIEELFSIDSDLILSEFEINDEEFVKDDYIINNNVISKSNNCNQYLKDNKEIISKTEYYKEDINNDNSDQRENLTKERNFIISKTGKKNKSERYSSYSINIKEITDKIDYTLYNDNNYINNNKELTSTQIFEIHINISESNLELDSPEDLEAMDRCFSLDLAYKDRRILSHEKYKKMILEKGKTSKAITLKFRIFGNGDLDFTYEPNFVRSTIHVYDDCDFSEINSLISSFSDTTSNIQFKKVEEYNISKDVTDKNNETGKLNSKILNSQIYLIYKLTEILNTKRLLSGAFDLKRKTTTFSTMTKHSPTNNTKSKYDSFSIENQTISDIIVNEIEILTNKLAADYILNSIETIAKRIKNTSSNNTNYADNTENLITYIKSILKQTLFLRHVELSDSKNKDIQKFLAIHKTNCNFSDSFSINQMMKKLKNNNPNKYLAINRKLLSFQDRSDYVRILNLTDKQELYHFTLNFDSYATIIDPLNSYPDIINQRVIKKLINYDIKDKKTNYKNDICISNITNNTNTVENNYNNTKIDDVNNISNSNNYCFSNLECYTIDRINLKYYQKKIIEESLRKSMLADIYKSKSKDCNNNMDCKYHSILVSSNYKALSNNSKMKSGFNKNNNNYNNINNNISNDETPTYSNENIYLNKYLIDVSYVKLVFYVEELDMEIEWIYDINSYKNENINNNNNNNNNKQEVAYIKVNEADSSVMIYSDKKTTNYSNKKNQRKYSSYSNKNQIKVHQNCTILKLFQNINIVVEVVDDLPLNFSCYIDLNNKKNDNNIDKNNGDFLNENTRTNN